MITLEFPLNYDAETVAVVFDPSDLDRTDQTDQTDQTRSLRVYDECGNWETALNYVQSGYIVIAMNAGSFPFVSVEILQERIDHEQELMADCFGARFPKLVAA